MKLFSRDIHFFRLLKEEILMVVQASSLLLEIFSDYENAQDRHGKINRLANDCNQIIRDINRELYNTFRSPMDREDIHKINRLIGALINSIKAISIRVGLFNLSRLTTSSTDIISASNSIVKEIKILIDELEKIKDISANMKKIYEIRLNAESLLRIALAELYEKHHETPQEVITTLQWTQIYDLIQKSLDTTEELTNTIELVILKNR